MHSSRLRLIGSWRFYEPCPRTGQSFGHVRLYTCALRVRPSRENVVLWQPVPAPIGLVAWRGSNPPGYATPPVPIRFHICRVPCYISERQGRSCPRTQLEGLNLLEFIFCYFRPKIFSYEFTMLFNRIKSFSIIPYNKNSVVIIKANKFV